MIQAVRHASRNEELTEIIRRAAVVRVVPLSFLQSVAAGAVQELSEGSGMALTRLINTGAEAYVRVRGLLLLRLFKNPGERPQLEAIAQALEQGSLAEAENLLLGEAARLLALAEERRQDGKDTGAIHAECIVPAAKMRAMAAMLTGLRRGREGCLAAAQGYAEVAVIVEKSDLGLACDYTLKQARWMQRLWEEYGDESARRTAITLLLELLRRFRGQSFSPMRERALDSLGQLLAAAGGGEAQATRLQWMEEYFNAALGEYSRHETSLTQAVALAGLGETLMELGLRETGTRRLKKAVFAFRLALRNCRDKCTPLALAEAWRDYGYALLALGGREKGARRLTKAVEAFEKALREIHCSRAPLAWAMIQDSIGIALAAIGECEKNSETIKKSLLFFRNALEVFTSEQARQQRAITLRHMEKAQESLARNLVRGLPA